VGNEWQVLGVDLAMWGGTGHVFKTVKQINKLGLNHTLVPFQKGQHSLSPCFPPAPILLVHKNVRW
jgi:hypothetical protein